MFNFLYILPFINTQSICDKYTSLLLKNNTSENQLTLLTLLVNTVVIGNYTSDALVNVPGILANGIVNGENVSLLDFFTGKNPTTNENDIPTKVNFLDDGGAIPLLLNKPANGTTSRQYFLLTHLYQFFGNLLGCSMQSSNNSFKNYQGDNSMYQVHKFMNLNHNQVSYFIQQVGLSAQSFGVSNDDISSISNTLGNLFNYKCLKPIPLINNQTSLQSICTKDNCPINSNSECKVSTSDSLKLSSNSLLIVFSILVFL
jgi:hypothetical protein